MKEITRRNFLKKSVAATVAAGMLPVLGNAGELMMSGEEPGIGGRGRRRCCGIRAKRILLISYDGICREGFLKANTPNLDRMLADGVLSLDTRVVMPSVTLPNWTSHLTGSGPEQHGITDNGWTLEKHTLPSVETDQDGYYPSVFKVLKDSMPEIKTAFYYNWINLFYPYNRRYFDDVNYLENDGYVPNFDRAYEFIRTHRDSPSLTFLYTVHTDHAGHKFQWMSPEYIRSIEEADAETGKLLEKLKAEGLYEDTHFMFLTDHGGIGYGHGGVSVDEMIVPWGIAGPGISKGVKMTEPNNTVNTAAVILELFGVRRPQCWTGEVPASLFG